MNFEKAIEQLTNKIEELKPESISPSWIYWQIPASYRYFYRHQKCSLGYVNWDIVTKSLPYEYQRKWQFIKSRKKNQYNHEQELQKLIDEYREQLYVFVCAITKEEFSWRDMISIRLARVAQAGNYLAWEYLHSLLVQMVDDWIFDYKSLHRLSGYNDLIEDKIEVCIRRFRYSGSFTTYLFRTLQYTTLGLRSVKAYSLDEPYFDTGRSKLDFVIRNLETGEVELFKK